jgi:hypothetical protein
MAKPVGLQRRVYLFGHSWVVAVPKRVRDHLRLKTGGAVYWHLTGPREALLTRGEQRIGGKPPGLDLADELKTAHREIDRLRRKVAERPQRVFNQGTSAGYSAAARAGFAFDATLRELRSDVRALRDEVARLSGRPVARRPRRGPRRSRPVETVAGPDDYPSPSPSPSSEVSGGDAASGGETPQAAHE